MNLTIGQVAKKMNISVYTLRYYDNEGLLPFVKRTETGVRIFDETDLEFLHVIDCLKKTGMPINDIRTFLGWIQEGDASLQKRCDMFQERKKEVDRLIAKLETYRECIEFKCEYYKKALEAGTEAVHWSTDKQAPEMPLSKIVGLVSKEVV
jgi:DNA-binding transcriptional MerR regulator